MSRAFSALLSGLACATALAAEAPAPEGASATFYAWVLAHPSHGLPSAAERAHLARLLSPQLMQLIVEAAAMESRCVKAAARGDKPLILEGDLFAGNYEGATEAAYGAVHREADRAVIDVDLIYVDPRFPKGHKHRAVAWKDSVELGLAGARWVVQDIKFQQDKSLASGLKDYLAEGARSCAVPAVKR